LSIEGDNNALLISGCGLPAFALPDYDDIGEAGVQLESRSVYFRRERWGISLAFDLHPVLGGNLTAADIGRSIDRDQTIRTIAGQADRTARSRMNPVAK
jgi:hypothetical protein